MDLRLPQSRGVDLVRAIRQYGGRLPDPRLQRDDRQRRGSPRADDARRRGLHQRIQRAAPHPAGHRAAPLPRQLQPPQQPARRAVGQLSFRLEHTIASATCANISKGGMALRTMNPLASGTKMRLRFRLPGSKRKSTPKRWWPGAISAPAWACSSCSRRGSAVGAGRIRRPALLQQSEGVETRRRVEGRESNTLALECSPYPQPTAHQPHFSFARRRRGRSPRRGAMRPGRRRRPSRAWRGRRRRAP